MGSWPQQPAGRLAHAWHRAMHLQQKVAGAPPAPIAAYADELGVQLAVSDVFAAAGLSSLNTLSILHRRQSQRHARCRETAALLRVCACGQRRCVTNTAVATSSPAAHRWPQLSCVCCAGSVRASDQGPARLARAVNSRGMRHNSLVDGQLRHIHVVPVSARTCARRGVREQLQMARAE